MIARLEEQKLLLNDPNYIRTTRTWVKTNGKLTPIDRRHRVLPWWRVNPDGSYVFFVWLGSKPIEFEKGKNAIAVPSLDKIPLVIDILMTAVRNGELDAQAKKPPTAVRSAQAGG
jgi:hypothetical protein